jgi:group I intron endonuclease
LFFGVIGLIRTENDKMNKKQLTKEYKLQKQPAGIYAVHNKIDNKMYIGASKNLPAVVRRFEFTLQMESFPYQELIDDYKKLGKDNFEIKILDELELKNETDKEITAELNELEELWIEKLKDDEVSFYNKKV